MKLYTMKCIKDPRVSPEHAGSLQGQESYFVKFEDSYEDSIYNDMSNSCDDNDYADFNRWLKNGIWVTDYDVYMYLMSSEKGYELNDTYEDADGLVWERVA